MARTAVASWNDVMCAQVLRPRLAAAYAFLISFNDAPLEVRVFLELFIAAFLAV